MDYGGTVDRQIIDQSVRGRDKLRIQAYHEIFDSGWVNEKLLLPSQECSSKSVCSRNKLLVSRLIFPTVDGDIDQLGPWDEKEVQLCKVCLNSLVVAHEKAREELWNRLPSFFGLSTWEELKDFDA